MLSEARNLSFRLQDINSLDFSNEFDVVISNATLHWVKDHNLLLGSTFQALKKNGVWRFNFAAKGNCSHFIEVAKQAMKLRDYASYFSGFEWPWYMPELETYESFVHGFPFEEVRVWGENADRYFSDVDSMVKWLDQPSLVPFMEHIPHSEAQRFRNYVVEKMIEDTMQKDGRCFETFRRINVLARK